MVLSKRTLLVAVVYCILLIIDNEAGEVWNEKAINLRTGSESIGVYRWNSSTQSEHVGCETNQLLFFLSHLVTHRCTLHGEVNCYPKISLLVNIQFPENSLLRHASKSDLSPLDQVINNLLLQINFRTFQE